MLIAILFTYDNAGYTYYLTVKLCWGSVKYKVLQTKSQNGTVVVDLWMRHLETHCPIITSSNKTCMYLKRLNRHVITSRGKNSRIQDFTYILLIRKREILRFISRFGFLYPPLTQVCLKGMILPRVVKSWAFPSPRREGIKSKGLEMGKKIKG